MGSKVSAGKDLTITAGQNVIAKAADLQAKGGVAIAAQGTVLLNAGQTRSSYDEVLTKSSSDLISTTTTRPQTQASAATAQVSSVQGQNVSIVAGQNLVSVGTQFKGKSESAALKQTLLWVRFWPRLCGNASRFSTSSSLAATQQICRRMPF